MASHRSPTSKRLPRVLLEGRPGVGKTTVAAEVVERLRAAGVAVGGFTTAEIRRQGRRVGFRVSAIGGPDGVMAHVDFPGPPRVGRYGVDLEAFEQIALPALETAPGVVVVIDELGKMELASPGFRAAVTRLFDGAATVMATVHVYRHPVTDELRARRDLTVLRVTESNRAQLADRVLALLVPAG